MHILSNETLSRIRVSPQLIPFNSWLTAVMLNIRLFANKNKPKPYNNILFQKEIHQIQFHEVFSDFIHDCYPKMTLYACFQLFSQVMRVIYICFERF